MKNIFIISFTTLLLLISSGCTEWLTIKPESEVVLEDYWQNETHVNQILASCYRSMLSDSYISRAIVWGELRSDNMLYGGGGDYDESLSRMAKWDIVTNNGYTSWGSFYTNINYCNTLLYYAPAVVDLDENFTESELKSIEAEVRTIRALSYFYLVRTFKEVPLVTEPSLDDTQEYSIPKSTEEDVLDFIESDLKTALVYARDRFDIEQYNKGRVTKNTVRALLSDIALWREDYASCIMYADEIINSGSYELIENEDMFEEVFYNGNSTESIFELQFDIDDNNSTTLNKFYHTESADGLLTFPPALLTGNSSMFSYSVGSQKEGENDIRQLDFLMASQMADSYSIFKYQGYRSILNSVGSDAIISLYVERNKAANWIVYRLSDIMLMKAEALAQEQRFEEALAIVNTIYLRANVDEQGDAVDALVLENYNSVDGMSSLVLRERQRELMFEGKRWFDLMRLARREGTTTSLLDYVSKKDNSFSTSKFKVMNSLYLPINSSEITANQALVQNPFYTIDDDGTITK